LPTILVSNSVYSFPVGKAGFNPFELVNSTTNVGGTVTVQTEEFDGSSGGTAGTGLSALNTNRYWQGSITANAGNFTNTAVRLTEATVTAANAIGKSATQGGSYDSLGSAVTGATITSNTISSFSFFNIGTAMTSSPPTIAAGGPLTRQQGSAASNSTIATVSDTSAGTLTVTAATVPTDISVTNIINSGGTVTADVAAGCNAAVGPNTVVLIVTNGTAGLSSTASLTVNVTANTLLTLTYNNASKLAGNATTVNPACGPSDNGSISAIVVQSVVPMPASGTITVNSMTGVVSVPDDIPAGTYTMTTRATDNCGEPTGVTDASFMLTVGCVNTLTINNLGDGEDFAPGNGVCETATGNGVCTLRAAIEESNALMACTPFSINFSVGLTGTINLATELPFLEHPNLTITGPGAVNLTVARNSATPFRIFAISASRTVTITGLKITNSLAPGTNNGGGVFNSGTLNLSQCVISGNAIETTSVGGSAFGRGIYSAGLLTIDQCEISGNSGRSGAGITHNGIGSGYPLTITNSTISGNTGVQSGGFDIRNTSATLTNCTISGNTAPGRIGGIDQVAQS
jgi:hypothetical protein